MPEAYQRYLNLKLIAEVANRNHMMRMLGIWLDFGTQPADIHRDQIALTFIVIAPDFAENLAGIQHAAGVLHKIVQQTKLQRRQLNRAAILEQHLVLDRIERDATLAQARRWVEHIAVAAAQHSLDACQ